MNINDLIGKRVLLKISSSHYTQVDVSEYKICEVSPTGNWVKMMDMNGRKFWKPIQSLAMVEVLREIEK
jgi:hypothetical protein